MYLLYPLQLFKLRKGMERISISRKSEEQKQKEMVIIHDELKNTINKTLQAIDKAYYDGKINIEDYNEMNIIIENLNSYFADMYGKYGDIDEEVREMVKSFYDPKIEEKGRQEGRKEGRAQLLLKLLTKKFNEIPEEYKNKIMELPDETIEIIGLEIFDIEDIKEVEKYF